MAPIRQSAIRAQAGIASQYETTRETADIHDEHNGSDKPDQVDKAVGDDEEYASSLIQAKGTPGSLEYEIAWALNAHAFVFRPTEWYFLVDEYAKDNPWWIIPPSAVNNPREHSLARRVHQLDYSSVIRPLYVMLYMLYPGHPYILGIKSELRKDWTAQGLYDPPEMNINIEEKVSILSQSTTGLPV